MKRDRTIPVLDGARELLRRERSPGYPLEYLFTRIRGRRAKLIRDWRPLVYDASVAEHLSSPLYQGFVRERTAEGMWKALLREHGWVHGQMDERTREMFAPYFLYAELRTIFICLRSLEGGKEQSAGEVLGSSLLSGEVKTLLLHGDALAALEGIEALFRGLSPAFAGLASSYEEQGLRESERFLVSRYLTVALEQPLHSVLRQLFRRIVDSRNILALYKMLRNGPADEPFLTGGLLPVEKLTDLRAKGDLLLLTGLIRQATGLAITLPEPTQIEGALYRGITRFLAGEGRDPLNEALLLDYLWRGQVEVMNLSVLLATKDLERDAVLAELVR